MQATDTLFTRPVLPELALLAVAAAVPALPLPWAAAAAAALALLWLATRPPRRELVLAGSALALAVVLLTVGAFGLHPRARTQEEWAARATEEYARLWSELDRQAGDAKSLFPSPPVAPETRIDAFARLAELARREEKGRASVLIVDADGEARAWGGRGLLHEPRPADLPRSGHRVEVGFSALTLVTVEPLDGDRRPWRVVVGRSFPTDELPFDPPGGEARDAFHWTVLEEGVEAGGTAAAGSLRLAPSGRPVMLVSPLPRPGHAEPVEGRWVRRIAWACLAFAFLALGVLRGVGLALTEAADFRRLAAVAGLALLGAAAGAAALSLPPPVTAALLIALALAAAGAYGLPARVPRLDLLVLLVPLPALAYQAMVGPQDLASDLPGGVEAIVLRLAAVLAVSGLLGLAMRRRGDAPPAPRGRWDLAALVLALAAGAVCDRFVLALLLVVAGALALARWLRQEPLRAGAGAWAAFLALSALLAGAAWESSYREILRHEIAGTQLPRMAPPEAAAMQAFRGEVEAFLGGTDLAALAGRPIDGPVGNPTGASPTSGGMDRRDLAYALWRQSPLARRNALSALVVVPREGPSSLFSFGLPLNEDREVDWDPLRWQDLKLAGWDELRLQGEVPLRLAGQDWGVARWSLLPRPGFALAEPQEAEQVLVGLLRGAPGDPRTAQGLPAPALYALYPTSGRALVSPWQDQPPVPVELAGQERAEASVRTPSGEAWAASRRGRDGYEVIYLPVLGPGAGLERVGTIAASVLLLAAAVCLPLLLLALPRPAFRDLLRRTVRSYSRRLVLVYTALLLLPLLGLNYVLLRTVETSLGREQRAQGEQALTAAEREVVNTLLSQAQGFAIETAVSQSYLKGLSRLVDHDVTVYFGSVFLASSTDELFTAGLLPRRIPGEAFARLSLLGFGIAARTNQVVDIPFVELYTPVALPDEPLDVPRIFLSVPLLAQQEEAAAVLAALRRRALVVSTGLFALMLVVGGRLARNFTRPLSELVEGTRRIAAGAPSLDLAPTELELAALVEAVDDMARRIARGREALLREKEVVERMVESITSGVVSLDAEQRVLMHNRVAADLLGSQIGEPLLPAVEARPSLAAVAAFLRRHLDPLAPAPTASADPAELSGRETVRLRDEAAGERDWTLVWVPLPGAGEPSALLVVEDVTEVFRSQRLAAWAEMARIIAHEIKNPLTPIRLTAEHMRQVWTRDREHFGEIFDRCTTNILKQVDELQLIASEFSIYSRIPKSHLEQGDLVPVLANLVEAYRTAPPPGIEVVFSGPAEPLVTRFDERLLSRAVRNLLENAVRASHAGGRVELILEAVDGKARIAVEDQGPGVPVDLLSRIFDPYFSTHDTGTGLGLPIARRIVEEHGGEIVARNRESHDESRLGGPGGLTVEIKIPLV